MNSIEISSKLEYLTDSSMVTDEMFMTILKTISYNNGVGVILGRYDENLTILSVSQFLLKNLGYTNEEFKNFTQNSFKNLFYGENRSFLEPTRFPLIHGSGEGEMITKDGTPVIVRMYKEDSVDKDGNVIWVMSVHVDWEHENVTLVNGAIKSGFWYFDFDENGRVVQVNWSHAFRRLLGFHDILDFPNELSSWSDRIHPLDREKIMNLLKRTINDKTNETKYKVEYRMKMADGTYQWFQSNAEIVRRTNGTARRMTGVFINSDEEKRIALQRKKSQAFHNAFTKKNLCEYYVNLKENTYDSMKIEKTELSFLENNKTWDELINDFVENYVCDEYKNEVKQFYVRDYIEKRIEKINGELNLECQIILNGTIHWIRNVILRGEKEESQYAIIFIRDITDAKREAEIHKQMMVENEAMGHLIQSVTHFVDHFAICDLENDQYEYSMINIKAGYDPRGTYHDLIKNVTSKFKTLERLDSMEELLLPENLRSHLINENDIYKFEYCSLEEDCYRSASFIPLEWKNEVLTKVLWISMDITQEKKQEIESRKALKDAYLVAKRANQAKTEFLTNMSHDIRTPMNAIVGLTAIAGANIQSSDKIVECLSKITSASRHLLGLINEVLDMSKIESGRITLEEEDFNLSDFVDNLVSLVKPSISAHKHHLHVHVKNIEHEDVCGDTLRIQQVFTNLMSNAIKYTNDGGEIIFTIEEKKNVQSKLGCYEFCIEDNGIGMNQEFQKIMFQPFTRADDKRTSKVQGTGLGMTIAQNIINMMNGDIQVESEPNKGTKIKVTVYLKLQNKAWNIDDKLMDLSVLVVDDDQITCESTVATLHEIGINSEWVTSGQEAIQSTLKRHEENNDYFAILMDWKMPNMDGIEATRQIRKQIGRDITIIVLTAYDYSEIEEEAKAAGVDAFITKPLFRSRLETTFKEIIHGKDQKLTKEYLNVLKKENFSKMRVLIVEDNELNREVAGEIIGLSGAKVDYAENGKIALDKIESNPDDWYDLVFMDIQMPLMNGYETTAAIRILPGKKGKIPIVAMTANAFVEDVEMAKSTGMNGHIAKPLDFTKLNRILKKFNPHK